MMADGDRDSEIDDRPRNDDGRFVEMYDSEDVIDHLAAAEEELTTEEIANEMGASYQTAYYYLRKLEDSGRVKTRKRAGARFWRVSEE